MSTQPSRMVGRLLAGLVLAATLGLNAPVGAQESAPASRTQPHQTQSQAAKLDRITLRSGRVIEGTILEETDTQIRLRATIAGIFTETNFQKDDVLTIERGVVAAPAPTADARTNTASPAASPRATPDAPPGAKRVYVIPLRGIFGMDISQTPIRNAVRDAQRQNADVIIIELDNNFSASGREGDQAPNDASQFEGFWRATQMAPVLTEMIDAEWSTKPRVAFWVKQAMGGAAFLPFTRNEIYMSSDARIGGIGRVEDLIRSGDQVVKEKLISARMGVVEGLAIRGGYDPRILRAMARTEYVLSYRMEAGRAVLLERMPEGPGEELLTDDGSESNRDDDAALARGQGNDVLTLTADLAQRLGVSRGTVDSFDDLMVRMGIGRNFVRIEPGGDRITARWREEIANARRMMPRLWREYQEIQPEGNPRDAEARANARRIAKINELQALIKRYEEALNPGMFGVPSWEDLELLKRQIRLGNTAQGAAGGGGGGGGGGRRGPSGP